MFPLAPQRKKNPLAFVSLLATFSLLLVALWMQGCAPPTNHQDACSTDAECREWRGDGFRCIARVCRKFEAKNDPPLADPGVFQRVRQNTTITLDGSRSRDPEGGPLAYAWSVVRRPDGSQSLLEGADTARPTILLDAAGDFTFELIVTDDQGAPSQPRQVTIEVFGGDANGAPFANARADQIVGIGQRVNLDGSASGDPDGDPITYAWRIAEKPDGSQASIEDADKVNAFFTPDLAGRYTIELVVDDNLKQSQPALLFVEAISDFDLVPKITELTPNEGFSDTTVKIRIKGEGFSDRFRILFDKRALPRDGQRFLSASELELTLNLSARTPGKFPLSVINPNRKESNAAEFTILDLPTPEITKLDPPAAPTGSRFDALKITGTGFVKDTEILFQSVPLPTQFISETEIHCKIDLIGVSPGPYEFRAINLGGRSSRAFPFTVTDPLPPPTLQVLNPPRAIAGEKLPFSVHGIGFSEGATILFDGKSIPSRRVRRDEVQADPELDLTSIAAGTYKVSVKNIDGQETAKLDFVVEGTDPTPILDRILPFFLYLDEANNKLAIYGESFRQGAQVEIAGRLLPANAVRFQSSTYIDATVDTTQGTWTVGEVNAVIINPGNKRSAPFKMTVAPRIPSISSITPGAWVNQCDTEVTVSGSNFQSRSELHFGSTVYRIGATTNPLQLVDSRTLKFFLRASTLTATSYTVFVRNATNAQSPNSTFTIRSATTVITPLISQIRPASAASDSKTSIALSYSLSADRFEPGAVVLFNGNPIPSTCSSTSSCFTLTGQLDLSGIPPGTYPVRAVNPCGQQSPPFDFIVTEPPTPYISEIRPASALVGEQHFIALNGLNFTTRSEIFMDGVKAETLFRSDKEISTSQRVSFVGAQPKVINIQVDNKNGQKSQIIKFALMPAAPPVRITNVSQVSFKRGASYSGVAILGAGFTPTSKVYFNNQIVASNYIAASQLTINSLNFQQLPAGTYYLQVEEGNNRSNEFPLFAEPVPPPVMDRISPATEFSGRSFTWYVYGTQFCEVTGTRCTSNPKIVIENPQGVDFGANFNITSTFISSTGGSQYAYGTLNTNSMPANTYKVFFELPTGERSNPALLNLQAYPDPQIDTLVWSPSVTEVYPNRVFTSLRVNGKYWRSSPPIPEFLIDGQPYLSDPPTTPSCVTSTITNTYCTLSNFSTAGLTPGQHTIQYRVNISGQIYQSQPFPFTITAAPPPVVTSMTPNIANPNTQVSVTLRGSHFARGAFILTTNLQVLPTTFVSETQLQFSVNTALLQTGLNTMVLENPDGQQSSPFIFGVQTGVPPLINYVTPDVTDAGSSSVVIYGTGFGTGDTVTIDGAPVTAVFNNTSTPNLTVSNYTFAAKTGPYLVQVTKAGGGTASNTFAIANREGRPFLRYVSPYYIRSGSTATVYLYGENIHPNATLTINNILQPNTAVFSTYIRTGFSAFTAPTVTTPTSLDVTARNPNGQTITSKLWIIPTANPYISSLLNGISISQGVSELPTTWYLSGSGFTTTSKIYIDNVEQPTRYDTSSRLYLDQVYDLSNKFGSVAIRVGTGSTASNTVYLALLTGLASGTRARPLSAFPFWSKAGQTFDIQMLVEPNSTAVSQPFADANFKRYHLRVTGPGISTPLTFPIKSCAGAGTTADPRYCTVTVNTTGWQVGAYSLMLQHKSSLESSGGTGFAIIP